ncbi:hypothetical protein MA16_Dca001663 [Dendrobium catenatum]|uniref:Uncharacterized protein n=1 Tax=Dendrobium catenatum TaxID=906689 RepID=A0A2I0WN25_9ASPA|nr:hypothetical protein MA16_Dca001663 [Dendrobium catenatum]
MVLIPIQGKNDVEASSFGLKLKVNRFITPIICDSNDSTTGMDFNHNLVLTEFFGPVTCGNGNNLDKPIDSIMMKNGDNLSEAQIYSNPWNTNARVKVNQILFLLKCLLMESLSSLMKVLKMQML